MISLKGSNLNIKGLGSMRLELCIICVLLGVFIAYNLACDCCKPTFFSKMFSREGFRLNPSNLNDNNLQHKRKQIYNPASSYEKVQIPLPEGQLFYYANNEFKPECCKNSSVSGTGGCACETEEQVKFLESRGGNKTYDIKDL
tara:strand:- start:364 stop:792 length:429 start_codon:yes stop_codon:yes gene_type:complete